MSPGEYFPHWNTKIFASRTLLVLERYRLRLPGNVWNSLISIDMHSFSINNCEMDNLRQFVTPVMTIKSEYRSRLIKFKKKSIVIQVEYFY